MSTPRTVRFAVEEFSISAKLLSDSLTALIKVQGDLLAEWDEAQRTLYGLPGSDGIPPETMEQFNGSMLGFTRCAEFLETSVVQSFDDSFENAPSLKSVFRDLPNSSAQMVVGFLDLKRKSVDVLRMIETSMVRLPDLRTPSLLHRIEELARCGTEVEDTAFSYQKSVKKLAEIVAGHPDDPDSGEAWKKGGAPL